MSNTKSISIFFDGTGNNGNNCLSEKYNKGSYELDPTNIFILYNNLKQIQGENDRVIYIEGIGTEDDKKDELIVKAAGEGVRYIGAHDKIDLAIKQFKKAKEELSKDKETKAVINVNLFGFSRGAALARIVAKEIHLKNDPYIKFNFIGLYDTVASFFLDLNHEYKDLNINNIPAKTIFQICASHENRKNFPLTSLFLEKDQINVTKTYEAYYIFAKDSINNDNKTKIIELYAPGSHNDIGGGRINLAKTSFKIGNKGQSSIKDNKIWKGIYDDYKKCNSILINKYEKKSSLSKDLQFVNLYTLANAAKKNGVNFNLNDLKELVNPKYPSKVKTIVGLEDLDTNLKLLLDIQVSAYNKVHEQTINEEIIQNDYGVNIKVKAESDKEVNIHDIQEDLFKKFIFISGNAKQYKTADTEFIMLEENYEKVKKNFSFKPSKPHKDWKRNILLCK